MRLLPIGLLTLLASTSWSAPALDGETTLPAAFKPEFVMSWGYCNMGSDLHRGNGGLVLECRASSNITALCSVRTGATIVEAMLATAPVKRAIKFNISSKGKLQVLTSPKEEIKIEVGEDKSAALDHTPWDMYSKCDGMYRTVADYRKSQDVARANAEGPQPSTESDSDSSSSSSSSKASAPAAKKGKGLGQSCKATSECESGRMCKVRTKNITTCQ